MRLFIFLLSLPLAAQQEQLNQLAKIFSTVTYYSATFITSQSTDVSINGVPQRMVTRRKVLVDGRNKRIEVNFNPASPGPMDVRIFIINDDQKWELTPSAKLVYSIRSPQVQLEPYEATPLHRASTVKQPYFGPDETIRLAEGPPHRCQVIRGKLEGEGPPGNRRYDYPVTYWIDRETGLPVQVLQNDLVIQILSFTPNDIAALDASKYIYTPQLDWKIIKP